MAKPGIAMGLLAAVLAACALLHFSAAGQAAVSGGAGSSPAGPASSAPNPEAIEALRRRLRSGEVAAVEAEVRRALEAAERAPEPDSMAVVSLLDLLVEALEAGGKAADSETLALAERDLALTERLVGTDHILYARALAGRGRVASARGDYVTARRFLERSLALRERLVGPDDPAVGRTLSTLGGVIMLMGDLAGARPLMERALAINEKAEGPEAASVGMAAANLGSLLMVLRELDQAVPLHERAVAILTRVHGEQSFMVAKALSNLAVAHELGGDFVRARTVYERSLAIREATLPPDHPAIGGSLHNLSILAHKMGDTRASADLARRALAIMERASGADHPETLRVMHSLGMYLHALGEDGEAEAFLTTALAGRERALGADHFDTAESLAGLGMLYLDAGKADRAWPLLDRSLAVREKSLGADHPVVATGLADLAHCETALGRRDAAGAHFERALAIRETRLGPDHPDVARSLDDLARFRFAGDRPGDALPPARRAAAILARHARDTIAALPERQALLLVEGQPHPEEILFSGLLARGGDAAGWLDACWEWILARRGAVLEELAGRHRRALLARTPEAQEAWTRLAAARTRLATLWVVGDGGDPEGHRRALDAARRNRETAEIDLARASGAYRDLVADEKVTPADLRRVLPGGSALIEWVRVRASEPAPKERAWRDIALVLGPGDLGGFVDLGPSAGIDAAVDAWRVALATAARALDRPVPAGSASSGASSPPDPMTALRVAGERLRARIWDPLGGRIGGAERLFLVPDGAIHAVDFSALPDPDGRYLIESGPTIQILSTGRDLARFARRRGIEGAPGSGLLAFGAPDFDATAEAQVAAIVGTGTAGGDGAIDPSTFRGPPPPCLAPARVRWPPIPASGREAERVAALLRGREPGLVLTGAAASEGRFKQEARPRRILHLATHAFFVGGDCGRAQDENGSPPPGNPLLLSGLVLAGANRPAGSQAGGDDGVLTAEELAALDLRAVDLAVLSACDTGRGTVSVGEGVFGLRRALEIAGARAVVMSLWPVPDRQAARFMTRFYRARLDDRPIPESSRAAALSALEDLRRRERPEHPYFWTGFVTAGDWH